MLSPLRVIFTFGFCPAAYVGLLIGLELAGANYMWESASDLGLLLFWSVLIFGIAGTIIGCIIAAVAAARRWTAGKLIFWTVTAIVAFLIFVDRFGWCYPCHQFLDTRSPHLIYTPFKSFMFTAALALGSVAVGTMAGGIAHALWHAWDRKTVKVIFRFILVGLVVVGCAFSYLSTTTVAEPIPEEGMKLPARIGGVQRLLIIVNEGLTWDIIDPLMAKHQLQAFERLTGDGIRGDLATIEPTLSHSLWASIATGRRPQGHGIGGKINYAYPGMERGIVTFPEPTRMVLPQLFVKFASMGFGSGLALGPNCMRAKTIWDIATDLGIEVGIVGWRNTWPVEKVKGFMVSRRLHDKSPKEHIFPRELEAMVNEVLDSLREPSIDHMFACSKDGLLEDKKAADRIRTLRGCLVDDLKYQATAERLFSVSSPTLMGLGFLSNDCIGHTFYYEHTLHHQPDRYELDSYLSQFTSQELVECFGPTVENAYVLHDSLLGLWADWLGPESALIIVSDHGFEMDGSNHYYAPPGILVCCGQPFRKGIEITGATLFDIAPTALYLLGLPVPDDMEGRLLEEAIDAQWLASNPIRTIPTYESLPYPRLDL